MDPWATLTTVLTVLATGLVTFGATWLKRRYDLKAESLRIEAAREDTKAQHELEDRRAAEQRTIEQSRAREDRDETAREAGRAEARSVIETFAKALNAISRKDERTSPRDMERLWVTEYDTQVRKAIELIRWDSVREDMLVVVGALGDFERLALENGMNSFGGYNMKLKVQILLELAGAASSGSQRSPELVERIN